MTGVDPFEREENDVQARSGLEEVTTSDDADLDRDLPEDEDVDAYARPASVPSDPVVDPADTDPSLDPAEDTVE